MTVIIGSGPLPIEAVELFPFVLLSGAPKRKFPIAFPKLFIIPDEGVVKVVGAYVVGVDEVFVVLSELPDSRGAVVVPFSWVIALAVEVEGNAVVGAFVVEVVDVEFPAVVVEALLSGAPKRKPPK